MKFEIDDAEEEWTFPAKFNYIHGRVLLGNVMAGFTHNFTYGSLSLSGGSFIRLVDNADNSAGSGLTRCWARSGEVG